MQRRTSRWAAASFVASLTVAALWWWDEREPEVPAAPPEVAIRELPMAGDPSAPNAEISGLAWHGDTLVLLPQYPQRFGTEGDGALFAIERAAIEAHLDAAQPAPLPVRLVPLRASGLEQAIAGFDGFEAIAFAGGDVYAAVESHPAPDRTVGHLVRGAIAGDLAEVVLDTSRTAQMPAQTAVVNTGYEAIVVQGDHVVALYELNGDINPGAHALVFDRALAPVGPLDIAPLEYRVTDATAMDAQGRFWVANYHWPGSPWQPAACRITERYGQGESHARCSTVERLVELRITETRIEPTERAPILLQLVDDEHARNWEGVVRLPGRGFLVATDEHPASILAFVRSAP